MLETFFRITLKHILRVRLIITLGSIFNIFNICKLKILSIRNTKNASKNHNQTYSMFHSDSKKCF